jgi:hypothetical protein
VLPELAMRVVVVALGRCVLDRHAA